MTTNGSAARSWAAAALAAAAVATLVAGLHATLPPGYDLFHFYWPTARAWLAGETRLYDALTAGFYSPPWTLVLLAPLGLLDLPWAMAVLTTASLLALMGVALAAARRAGVRYPALAATAVVVCPYTLQVLFVGSLDALSLVGLAAALTALRRSAPLGFGAGLMLAAIRPQNLLLTGPVLLVLAWRAWGRRGLLRACAVPLVVLAACVPLFGADWPLRWWEAWRAYPPIPYLVTSTYAATNLAGVPAPLVVVGMVALAGSVLWRAWRAAAHLAAWDGVVALAVAANAALSPYLLSQSYSVVLALGWTWLLGRRPGWAAALYLLSLPMLLRAGGLWDRVGLIDVCFPLLLTALLLEHVARQPEREAIDAGGQAKQRHHVHPEHPGVGIALAGNDGEGQQQQPPAEHPHQP